MKLYRVTITGADDSIKPEELLPLSRRYPFVEWGILFSQSKQGQNRYPSEKWVRDLREIYFKTHLSAHLCGQWVRDILHENFSFLKDCPAGILHWVGRMQLNMTDDDFMSLDFARLRETLAAEIHPSLLPNVILQTRRPFQRHEWLRLLNRENYGLKLQLLYDVSGGRGKEPKVWPVPAEGVDCGYAGGLRPDNLAKHLVSIAEAVGETPVWVDMESGVRDDKDRFDLERAAACLEIAKKWVHEEVCH